METVNCGLCGADRATAKVLYDFSPWQIVRCRHCGLVYLSPRPGPDEIEGLYSESYFSGHLTNQYPRDLAQVEAGIGSMSWLLELIIPYRKAGRLLEIGCSTGFALAYARRQGWETWGVEISAYASEYARTQLGLNVHTGTVEQANLPERYFDVVLMSHVVEHLPDPIRTLQRTRCLMRDDGLLVIRCPDITSLDARYYGKDWEGLRVPYHCYHFSPATLKAALRRAGFKMIALDYWVSPLVMEPISKLLMPKKIASVATTERISVEDQTGVRSVPQNSAVLRKARRWAFHAFKRTIGYFLRGRTMTMYATPIQDN